MTRIGKFATVLLGVLVAFVNIYYVYVQHEWLRELHQAQEKLIEMELACGGQRSTVTATSSGNRH